ncbi:hypothetical protein AB0A63_02050 [Lentzea sp. NPDC042327]|uniref:uridine kinase family protein n=1 Tax=Lentzea sp. NPDC042327 TaxID=3154801 RepID=UPI0033DA6136
MRLRPGEVEAAGWRVVPLGEVVRRLVGGGGSAVEVGVRPTADGPSGAHQPGLVPRPVIVGIDGRGGAGKSALAERLHHAVPRSWVVHTDDIAWNQAYFDWAGLLTENVLRPLHRGEAVEFRPPAWVAHDRPGAVVVPAGADVVWVEGTGVVRAELGPWLDASVWVQGDLDEQERRLVARDGDSPEQQRHVAAWLAEEVPFLEREQPWLRAAVVVNGTPELPHDPATEIVVAA